jgi:hypothetical protein
MDRSTRKLFALGFIVVFAITGAAVLIFGGVARSGPSAAPDLPTAIGVITAVDSAGLSNIKSFTLRQADGSTASFELAKQENAVQFPAGHLQQHLATARLTQVWYRNEGGVLYAIRLADAPLPGGSPPASQPPGPSSSFQPTGPSSPSQSPGPSSPSHSMPDPS